jgi:hypothetical protein
MRERRFKIKPQTRTRRCEDTTSHLDQQSSHQILQSSQEKKLHPLRCLDYNLGFWRLDAHLQFYKMVNRKNKTKQVSSSLTRAEREEEQWNRCHLELTPTRKLDLLNPSFFESREDHSSEKESKRQVLILRLDE